jgi:cellulose synthase/poly-beta-1,6-N-acetylglucosamine synthase-like glycosyltransferase
MTRFYEIFPGLLSWLTLILIVAISHYLPVWAAIFIILFDIYWLLKTIYLSLHLRNTYVTMRRYMKLDWLNKLKQDFANRYANMHHLVILPFYNEPYEVISESFESILHANYPLDKFIVVLGAEEKAGKAAMQTAEKIREKYEPKFLKLLVTNHPADLPGELAGKGSNETWAAKQAEELVIQPFIKEGRFSEDDVLVSSFDVDTQIYPEYFGRLTYSYLSEENREHAIYQPVPLFNNNVYQAPALARVVAYSTTFWQMMQQSRPERLTSFSSQSIPLRTLREMNYWHTHVVSEDSRIFWQGYLHYHGDFRVVPLFYPVSMDANVGPTFWQTMKNLYRQHRRWGWGVENIPYMLDGFGKDERIPKKKKWYWGFISIEGFHSWATNSLIIFALGWLPTLIGGQAFRNSLLSYNLPQITNFIINLSSFGIASAAILGVLLLPPKPEWFRAQHYLFYVLQWILIPVTLIVFGTLPALDAQTRLMLGGRFRLGFWVTPKNRVGSR